MIEFLKDKERLKFSLMVLGIYFLTTIVWKELFGIFHYILPFLGILGSIYTSITGWISFLVAYTILSLTIKRKPKYKFSLLLLISILLRIAISLVIAFVPFTSFLNYLYPILMIYILDYLHRQKVAYEVNP